MGQKASSFPTAGGGVDYKPRPRLDIGISLATDESRDIPMEETITESMHCSQVVEQVATNIIVTKFFLSSGPPEACFLGAATRGIASWGM